MKNNYIIYLKSEGTSMMPMIDANSEILINLRERNFGLGDIVCFLNKGGLIVHRIVKINNKDKKIVLKGDNNLQRDGLYDMDQIDGKVIYILKNNGVISTAKFSITHKLLSQISLYSENIKLLSRVLFPIRTTMVLGLEALNHNTGINELMQIIKSLKDGRDFSTNAPNCDPNLLKLLSLKNKSINSFQKDNIKKIKQQFFTESLNIEKDRIYKLLDENNIIFSSLDNIEKDSKITGSDIDILVNYNQLAVTVKLLIKNGYEIKNKPPQEVTLINKVNKIQVDLHYLLNLPRHLYFNKKKSAKLAIDYINNNFRNEYFLFSKIVCFWTNDFLKGLNTLHSIGDFCKNHPISWKNFHLIAKKYKFLDESQLVLLIYKNVFNDDVFDDAFRVTSWKTKIVSSYYDLKKIGVSGSIKNWWDENNQETNKLHIRCYLTSLIIGNKVSTFRLIRPRIVLLFLTALLKHFTDSAKAIAKSKK